ncbi:MAG: hypothetical protein FWG92_05225 [Leptospirales bacterium]|nr:hypothetical protein [Leptospirales bacterium]
MMENKTLTLEGKKCIALDLGRAYIEYSDIDELCLKTFPDEALHAVQAFKNVVNADIYDPGEENKGFSNHVGWLEPVKETLVPDADAIAFIEKAASEIRAKSDVLLFAGSGSACLAVKAGLDFFAPDEPLEIIFLGDLNTGHHKRLREKLKGRKFAICAVEDKDMPHRMLVALNDLKGAEGFYTKIKGLDEVSLGDVKGPEKFYVFSNNSESAFCGLARKSGAEILIYNQEFTGPSLILSPGVLLPLAAAGVDIKGIIEGAALEEMLDMESYIPSGCAGGGASRELMMPLSSINIKNYSTARRLLKDRGLSTELLVYADPAFTGFTNWLKYLSMNFAGDTLIHTDAIDLANNAGALENYAQTNKGFFETFIHVGALGRHNIEELKAASDLDSIGAWLITDSMQKQRKTGVPIIRMEVPETTPYFYGQMISLFSRNAAIMDIWK